MDVLSFGTRKRLTFSHLRRNAVRCKSLKVFDEDDTNAKESLGRWETKKTTILAPVAARSQQPDRPSVSFLTS